MRPPHELNGDGIQKPIIINDPTIDFESNARPGRELHDRAEFAKSRFEVLRTQTVSFDTHFLRIYPYPCSVFARVFLSGPPPRPNLPSPPPP